MFTNQRPARLSRALLQSQRLCVHSLELKERAQRAVVSAFVIVRQNRRNARLIGRVFPALAAPTTPIDISTYILRRKGRLSHVTHALPRSSRRATGTAVLSMPITRADEALHSHP
jgi:hypothetical protein